MSSSSVGAALPRVVAVIVSFNRKELLLQTLRGISNGDCLPDVVVVIDNASTDGSANAVADLEFPIQLDLVRLESNVGGAGGFTIGFERAVLDHKPDLVWVMDDDTEPQHGTLSAAIAAWEGYPGPDRPALVASRVAWTDGRDHPMNTMRQRLGASRTQRASAAAVGGLAIRSASFVSVFIAADAILAHGLPIADYFIWNDDFEYSTRLARRGNAIYVPASTVIHHTKSFGATDVDPGARFYNDVRNKFWMFGRSRSLAPWEKVVYGGGTLIRWSRTLIRSSNRKLLLAGLRKGIRDSLRAPRRNEAVLAGVYPLRRVESR